MTIPADVRLSSFNQLPLREEILKAISESGYVNPTPIQSKAIPLILNGKDILASADTGTGKTAAFMLPALQMLSEPSNVKSKGPRVLVLTPTRELAGQISKATKEYGKYIPRIKTVSILGGMPYEPQRKDLRHYVDVLVATPGRLLDHTREGKVDYSRVELFVLDEADRMLDMGFLEDVQLIAKELPKNHQTVLFSATLKRVLKLAKEVTKDPITIEIESSSKTNDNIEQSVIYVDDENHKRKILKNLISDAELTQAIVFSATKAHTEILSDDIDSEETPSTAIHGDLRQRSREAIIRKLRSNRIKVLVATDVAARGIDIPGLSLVVNYDMPRTAEDYTHRIGRTGRAGAKGKAITFVSNKERSQLRGMESVLGHSISVIQIPGLEAKSNFESNRNSSGRNRSNKSRGSNSSRNSNSFRGSSNRDSQNERSSNRSRNGNRRSSSFRGNRASAPNR
jgi:superfamily II DNA/RNA helicase